MASLQAFHDHFSHETYKHHTSTVTCWEGKLKNPPGQNDHSRQKQTTRKYFFVLIIILGHEYTGRASLVQKSFPKKVSPQVYITLQKRLFCTIGRLKRRFQTCKERISAGIYIFQALEFRWPEMWLSGSRDWDLWLQRSKSSWSLHCRVVGEKGLSDNVRVWECCREHIFRWFWL